MTVAVPRTACEQALDAYFKQVAATSGTTEVVWLPANGTRHC
jgi:hypothetical protein